MLFVEGSDFDYAGNSHRHATLHEIEDADHSFHVPARTGRKDAEVIAELADVLAEWDARLTSPARL